VGKQASAGVQDFDFVERARDLAARAQKLRRKGELRRAAVALREACALEEGNAARWVSLGNVLFRMGKREEAAHALKQAVYLRERRGERTKANAIRRILLNLARAPTG
jgi:cytochrome c-type biogenesis protein CcmH/NrfG